MTGQGPGRAKRKALSRWLSGHPQPHRGSLSSMRAGRPRRSDFQPAVLRAHPDRPFRFRASGHSFRAHRLALSDHQPPDLRDRWLLGRDPADSAMAKFERCASVSRRLRCLGGHGPCCLMTVSSWRWPLAFHVPRNEAYNLERLAAQEAPRVRSAGVLAGPDSKGFGVSQASTRLKPADRRLPPAGAH